MPKPSVTVSDRYCFFRPTVNCNGRNIHIACIYAYICIHIAGIYAYIYIHIACIYAYICIQKKKLTQKLTPADLWADCKNLHRWPERPAPLDIMGDN